VSDEDFATHIQSDKESAKNSYEFLEASAFNAIADENDAKTRMSYIERFAPVFPNSRFEEQITSYAMVALSELKDTARLVSFGEKTLQANPDSLPVLLLLAGTYVDDSKPGSLAKAITYSQKAIQTAKADAPDADRSRKVSAGVAHYTLGYAYLKQEKATAAVPELKTASTLLKGQDDQQYAITLFRLGFAYAKLNKVTESREVLMEAVKIPGPVQQPAQDLLLKVNAARAKGR
jgi:tetratricopeptide (TPR) repeat protein